MLRKFVTETPSRTAKSPAEPARAALGRDELERPSGPAAAVLLAAGLASFSLGLLSTLTAVSASVSSALTVSDRVGDISGVTAATSLVFFSTWGVLAAAWRGAEPPLIRVAAASGVLIALGLLGTFPPFFNALGG